MNDVFHCRACGKTTDGATPRTHCPHCLSATHAADMFGEECGGRLTPVGIWVRDDHVWEILGKCSVCGEFASTPVSEGDNPTLLLSLAHRPLANPPFPIEKIEEMTAAMGGSGDMGGYDA